MKSIKKAKKETQNTQKFEARYFPGIFFYTRNIEQCLPHPTPSHFYTETRRPKAITYTQKAYRALATSATHSFIYAITAKQ